MPADCPQWSVKWPRGCGWRFGNGGQGLQVRAVVCQSLSLCTAGDKGTSTVTVFVDAESQDLAEEIGLRFADEYARAMGITDDGEIVSCPGR